LPIHVSRVLRARRANRCCDHRCAPRAEARDVGTTAFATTTASTTLACTSSLDTGADSLRKNAIFIASITPTGNAHHAQRILPETGLRHRWLRCAAFVARREWRKRHEPNATALTYGRNFTPIFCRPAWMERWRFRKFQKARQCLLRWWVLERVPVKGCFALVPVKGRFEGCSLFTLVTLHCHREA